MNIFVQYLPFDTYKRVVRLYIFKLQQIICYLHYTCRYKQSVSTRDMWQGFNILTSMHILLKKKWFSYIVLRPKL